MYYADYVDEIDDRRPYLGPNGLNEEPSNPTTLKLDEPMKFGQTKYGQLTLFPCIDEKLQTQKKEVPPENS